MLNVDCTRRAYERNPEAEKIAEAPRAALTGPQYWCRVARAAVGADISDPAFRVMVAIESLSDRQGRCYETDASIAQATGKSLSAVSRALKELVAKGWLARAQEGRVRRIAFTFELRGRAEGRTSESRNDSAIRDSAPGRLRPSGRSLTTVPCIKREKEEPKSEEPRSAGPAREGPAGPTGESKSGREKPEALTVDQAVELAKGPDPVLAQFGRAALVKEGWTAQAIEDAVGPVARGLPRSMRSRPKPSRGAPASRPPAPPGCVATPSPRGMTNLLARSLRPPGRRE